MQLFSSLSNARRHRAAAHSLPFRLRRTPALALFAALAAGPAFGQIWDFPQPHPAGKYLNITTQIVLRRVTGVYDAPPPPAVVTVPPSTKVTFSLPFAAGEIRTVTWFKDGEPLDSADQTLVIEAAASADEGVYTAVVEKTTKDLVVYGNATEKIHLQVGVAQPHTLAALSTRTTLSPANPTLIAGFVLDGGTAAARGTKAVLIRGVGPSLAHVGVARPLPQPVVTIYDAAGKKIDWPEVYIPELNPYALASLAAPAVGAFPLRESSRDFAIVQFLPPGAYTAHVSSGDGSEGDVLLEIYEISDEVLAAIAPDYFAPPLLPVEPSK
jgi:hypothetical protein